MAYFVLKKDGASEWRWTLKANNHEPIADSGEGYKNKADCLAMARHIRSEIAEAPIWEPETDKSAGREWRKVD